MKDNYMVHIWGGAWNSDANPSIEKDLGIVDGEMTHKRTVFVGVFEYHGEEFIIHKDFGYEYPKENAVYMFTEGNYSCDCNRSAFIRSQYGYDSIPDLDCGWEIKLKDYGFVYLD